jgi:hypothetical protein
MFSQMLPSYFHLLEALMPFSCVADVAMQEIRLRNSVLFQCPDDDMTRARGAHYTCVITWQLLKQAPHGKPPLFAK